MWLASILSSGAASLGRVLMVGLLPNALVVVFAWALIRAGSFSGQSDWSRLIPTDLRADVLAILLALAGIVLLTVIFQPFQIRMVRLLEGYWQRWWLTARLAPVFVEFQVRRLRRLRARAIELDDLLTRPQSGLLSVVDQIRENRRRGRYAAELDRVMAKMARYPKPPPDLDDQHLDEKVRPYVNERIGRTELLPTALGNALRVAETSAGERYGLDTLSSWPRLYSLFSDKFSALQASARDGLDAAVNLCVSFALVTVLAIPALADEPKAYWIPVVAAILCVVSYLGAIAAAVDYGGYVLVAYDLHRFDLLKAMHHKLPDNPADEFAQFRELSRFFEEERRDADLFGLALMERLPIEYDHTHEKKKEDDKKP